MLKSCTLITNEGLNRGSYINVNYLLGMYCTWVFCLEKKKLRFIREKFDSDKNKIVEKRKYWYIDINSHTHIYRFIKIMLLKKLCLTFIVIGTLKTNTFYEHQKFQFQFWRYWHNVTFDQTLSKTATKWRLTERQLQIHINNWVKKERIFSEERY